MSNHSGRFKNRRTLFLFGIVLILIVLFTINLSGLIRELNYAQQDDDPYELSQINYELNQGNYPRVLTMVKMNKTFDTKPIKDTKEYEEFADYYEAYVYCKIYQKLGDTKMLKKYEKIKKQKKGNLTSYRFIKALEKVEERW